MNIIIKCFRLLVIITMLFGIPLLAMIMPIKFCLSSLPTDNNENFYIVRYSYYRNKFILFGDKTGFYSSEPEHLAHIKGNKNPFGYSIKDGIVSNDLSFHNNSTMFIIYGTDTIDEYWDEKYYGDTTGAVLHTIYCTKWDVLGKVETMNKIRHIFPRNYLNIFDYKWFDILRDRLFNYLDGETRW